jgi:hypothetical protein
MRQTILRGVAIAVLAAPPAWAFPPYRSTDADTAGAGVLELRLGLAKVQRQESSSSRSTPLTRTNFGIGAHYEIISEFEYSADEDHLAEGALGFKWARLDNGFGMGVETLLLLPVQSAQSGSGIESQFLMTLQREGWQLHANAGGFYDPRGPETERGWRASLLVEFPRRRFRPGVELFAKDARGESARVQAGLGLIKQFQHFELRSGIHFGLSDNAPDVEASLWLAWRWRVLGD